LFHYTHHCKAQKCYLGWYSFQKSGQSPPPSQGIRVPSNEHEDLLNRGAPKGLLPWQGRSPPRRRPDRHSCRRWGCSSHLDFGFMGSLLVYDCCHPGGLRPCWNGRLLPCQILLNASAWNTKTPRSGNSAQKNPQNYAKKLYNIHSDSTARIINFD
jgi:hypothetical protein